MEKPLVTVFIPVYNCEDYIAGSLESILNQTYDNLEVLLVDDGSTDNSVDVIKTYKDDRIRLVSNEKNMGIPYTRNVGLREARGKYMVIMDSDDISVPERVETQVNYLEENPEIDAAGSFYYRVQNNFRRKIRRKYTKPDAVKIYLMFFNPLANPSTAVRKSTVEQYNLQYNLDYFVAQDYEFWIQLSKVGNISIIPEFLLEYRTGHESVTKKAKREKLDQRKQLINGIHQDILDHYHIPLSKEEMEVYNEFFSYNYGTVENIPALHRVVEKLRNWNETENDVFDKKLFSEVMDYAILVGLSNQGMEAWKKIHLYNKLTTHHRTKDRYFILAKHAVQQARKKLK